MAATLSFHDEEKPDTAKRGQMGEAKKTKLDQQQPVYFRPIRYELQAEIDQFFGMTPAQKRQMHLRFRDEHGKLWYDSIEQEEFRHLLPSPSSPSSPRTPTFPDTGENCLTAFDQSRRSSAASAFSTLSPLESVLEGRRRSNAGFLCSQNLFLSPIVAEDSINKGKQTICYFDIAQMRSNGEKSDAVEKHDELYKGHAYQLEDHSDCRFSSWQQDRNRQRRKRSASAVQRGNKVHERIQPSTNKCGAAIKIVGPAEDLFSDEKMYDEKDDSKDSLFEQRSVRNFKSIKSGRHSPQEQISLPAFLPLRRHQVDQATLDEAFPSRLCISDPDDGDDESCTDTSVVPPRRAVSFSHKHDRQVLQAYRHHPGHLNRTHIQQQVQQQVQQPRAASPPDGTSNRVRTATLRTGEHVYDGLEIPCASVYLASDDEMDDESDGGSSNVVHGESARCETGLGNAIDGVLSQHNSRTRRTHRLTSSIARRPKQLLHATLWRPS